MQRGRSELVISIGIGQAGTGSALRWLWEGRIRSGVSTL